MIKTFDTASFWFANAVYGFMAAILIARPYPHSVGFALMGMGVIGISLLFQAMTFTKNE
jgi:hypothetical protein